MGCADAESEAAASQTGGAQTGATSGGESGGGSSSGGGDSSGGDSADLLEEFFGLSVSYITWDSIEDVIPSLALVSDTDAAFCFYRDEGVLISGMDVAADEFEIWWGSIPSGWPPPEGSPAEFVVIEGIEPDCPEELMPGIDAHSIYPGDAAVYLEGTTTIVQGTDPADRATYRPDRANGAVINLTDTAWTLCGFDAVQDPDAAVLPPSSITDMAPFGREGANLEGEVWALPQGYACADSKPDILVTTSFQLAFEDVAPGTFSVITLTQTP